MERIHPADSHQEAGTADRTLRDLVAAIDLVAGGGARRVVLSNLPDLELVAAEALAHAQGAGLPFSLSRGAAGARPAAVVGPIEG